jgi:hypothetical protein
MTGDYLINNSQFTGNTNVLVSVQVFPLADLATAMRAYDEFHAMGLATLGVWCPLPGAAGNDVCGNSQGFMAAQKYEFLGYHHRYFVEALAIAANLSTNSGLQTFLQAAAQAAFNQVGPGVY